LREVVTDTGFDAGGALNIRLSMNRWQIAIIVHIAPWPELAREEFFAKHLTHCKPRATARPARRPVSKSRQTSQFCLLRSRHKG
jgi:hypothetical protein